MGQDGWFWGRPDANFDFEFGDLGDIVEEMFGFGTSSRHAKKDNRRGKDIHTELEITLEEAFEGAQKEFTISHYAVCSRCNGSGAEPGTKSMNVFRAAHRPSAADQKNHFWIIYPRFGLS